MKYSNFSVASGLKLTKKYSVNFNRDFSTEGNGIEMNADFGIT